MTNDQSTTRNSKLPLKIILACTAAIVALLLPAAIFQKLEILQSSPNFHHLFKSFFVAILVVLSIWMLRKKVDKGNPTSIGLGIPSKAISQFLLGFGLILIPMVLAVIICAAFGWADVTINTRSGIIYAFILGLVSTLFTDALSEELVFRGYIYSNLKTRFSVWKSSIITLLIFVTVPIIIIYLQNMLGVTGSVSLSGNYIVTLFIFGAFIQYLRVLFKTIWVGVGFHLFFVHMNTLMGPTDDTLIQFSETSNQQALQIILIILLGLVFLGLILYPFIQKRKAVPEENK